jgi:hypothetical protein
VKQWRDQRVLRVHVRLMDATGNPVGRRVQADTRMIKPGLIEYRATWQALTSERQVTDVRVSYLGHQVLLPRVQPFLVSGDTVTVLSYLDLRP